MSRNLAEPITIERLRRAFLGRTRRTQHDDRNHTGSRRCRAARESPSALGADAKGERHHASAEGQTALAYRGDFALDMVPAAKEGPRAGSSGAGCHGAASDA